MLLTVSGNFKAGFRTAARTCGWCVLVSTSCESLPDVSIAADCCRDVNASAMLVRLLFVCDALLRVMVLNFYRYTCFDMGLQIVVSEERRMRSRVRQRLASTWFRVSQDWNHVCQSFFLHKWLSNDCWRKDGPISWCLKQEWNYHNVFTSSSYCLFDKSIINFTTKMLLISI